MLKSKTIYKSLFYLCILIAILFMVVSTIAVANSPPLFAEEGMAGTEGGTTDTGTGDTGTGDTGTVDTGTGDTATGDTGTVDTTTGDTTTGDTGTVDTTTGDTGTVDTAPGDTATGDTGTGDTGTVDTGTGDTAPGDTATGDTGTGDQTDGATTDNPDGATTDDPSATISDPEDVGSDESATQDSEVESIIQTDKPDYGPNDTVLISGTGFDPGAEIELNVTKPDGSVDTWTTTADESGNINTTYQLEDGFMAEYAVTASDGEHEVQTTFTDCWFTVGPMTVDGDPYWISAQPGAINETHLYLPVTYNGPDTAYLHRVLEVFFDPGNPIPLLISTPWGVFGDQFIVNDQTPYDGSDGVIPLDVGYLALSTGETGTFVLRVATNDGDTTYEGLVDTWAVGLIWTPEGCCQCECLGFSEYESRDEGVFGVDSTSPDLDKDMTFYVSGSGSADITLDAYDTLSGVAYIQYSIDGGPWVTVPGNTATITVTGAGVHTISHVAYDLAGNSYDLGGPQEFTIKASPPLTANIIAAAPVIVIDMMGQIASYPVTEEGRLISEVSIESPDGAITFEIPAECLVLNMDGTPTYQTATDPLPDIIFKTVPIEEVPPAPSGYMKLAAYECTPPGATFACDASIIVQYDPTKVPEGIIPVLAFYNEETGEYEFLEIAGHVVGGPGEPNMLISNTTQITYFVLLAKSSPELSERSNGGYPDYTSTVP